jgi:Protein of unknown function (DUF3738)
MQAVLADRFHLAVHYESRQLPVYALLLAKPGETGPQLTFEWTARRVDRANPRGEKPAPEFVQDLHDQLGLRLEPQTGPAEVFIIDHVEPPSEN